MQTPIVSMMLMLVLVVGGGGQGAWKPFASKEGGFSVMMPGTPKPMRQSLNTQAGPIAMNMFVLDMGTTAYVVMFSDYPEAGVKKAGAAKVLKGARDGAVNNARGAKLLSEKQISLNGHPGVELKMEQGAQGILLARLYMVRNRLYQAICVVPKSRAGSGDMERFVGSFKLTK
jgi:hypothetical protein